MKILKWPDLKLQTAEIFRRMGMPDENSERSRKFKQLVEEMRERALELMEAQCIYDYVPVEINGTREIMLDKNRPLSCTTKFFEGAEEAAIAVLTVGRLLDEETDKYSREGKYVEAMALEACATAAIDECLELLRQELKQELSLRKMEMGYNISPGGNHIPLEGQQVVFSLISGEKIGVSLSEAFMMIPIKSHSILIPVGKQLKMPNNSCAVTCEMCSLQNSCAHSRKKFSAV